jgi:tetratricopeptide (TPR) repeat protein
MLRATIAAALLAACLGASAQQPQTPPPHPSVPDTLTMRAAQRLQAGDMQGALGDVNMAILRDSRNSGAYALRGTIRMTGGDRPGALLDFSRSIELTPDVKGIEIVYANRANLYWLDGKHTEAAADVARALQLKPDFALAFNLRGRLKADNGDLDGARADFDRAIQLEPKMMPAYVARAAANLQAGRLQEAISDYKTLMWSLPNDADVVASHGIVRGMLGETAAGVDDLLKARAMNPKSVSDEPRGPQSSPAQRLDDFIAMNPGEARAYLMRSVVSYLNNEGARGLQDISRAVQIDPKLRPEAEAIRSRLAR